MQVASSFDFGGELRRIALAQALRSMAPTRLASWTERNLAYAAEGLGSRVTPSDDADALRRHLARPARHMGEAV